MDQEGLKILKQEIIKDIEKIMPELKGQNTGIEKVYNYMKKCPIQELDGNYIKEVCQRLEKVEINSIEKDCNEKIDFIKEKYVKRYDFLKKIISLQRNEQPQVQSVIVSTQQPNQQTFLSPQLLQQSMSQQLKSIPRFDSTQAIHLRQQPNQYTPLPPVPGVIFQPHNVQNNSSVSTPSSVFPTQQLQSQDTIDGNIQETSSRWQQQPNQPSTQPQVQRFYTKFITDELDQFSKGIREIDSRLKSQGFQLPPPPQSFSQNF